jgi:hypothetical protein
MALNDRHTEGSRGYRSEPAALIVTPPAHGFTRGKRAESIRATRSPASSATAAAFEPAGPAPTMMRSKSSTQERSRTACRRRQACYPVRLRPRTGRAARARALGLEPPSRLTSLGRLRSDPPAPSVGFRTLNGAVDLPDRTQVIRQVSDAGDDAVQFHLRHLARCSEGLPPPRRRVAEAGT